MDFYKTGTIFLILYINFLIFVLFNFLHRYHNHPCRPSFHHQALISSPCIYIELQYGLALLSLSQWLLCHAIYYSLRT